MLYETASTPCRNYAAKAHTKNTMFSLLLSRAGVYNDCMKKETVVTIRVTPELKAIIQKIAEEDDRTVGWMAMKLIIEALEARSVRKKEKVEKKR